jgi:CRISPR type I-E-associated protein CasB/Cse2
MSSDRDEVVAQIRAVRKRYDDTLSDGDRARLRRAKSIDEVALEGAYWRIAEGASEVHPRTLQGLVMLFGLAPQRSTVGFALGRFLRERLVSGEEGKDLRFRRLIARDRDELVHRLRGVLRLACGGDVPVDWGALGADLHFWSDRVRREWAQSFYAPSKQVAAQADGVETKEEQ